ncbi:MAG: Ig-like domain-containing protein [Candidatus Bathyarchaeia archaeon]
MSSFKEGRAIKKCQKAALLTIILLTASWAAVLPAQSAENLQSYERVYSFYVQIGKFQILHKLYVSVLPSLYEYYKGRSHSLPNSGYYPKFITPKVVKSIAEAVGAAIPNNGYKDEQFANAVLTIIQQFSYQECDIKYPVETIVDGFGDCDVLSILAASILKAGGLDVILLYYDDKNPRHMNIGVHLSHTPVYHNLWLPLAHYEYNGKKYWVAECTPLRKWRIGNQPQNFMDSEARIISIENLEENSPGCIRASLDKPSQKISSLSMTIHKAFRSENYSLIALNGLISPKIENASITLYSSKDGVLWEKIQETTTDLNGRYLFKLRLNNSGIHYFRASWSGNSEFAGSDSGTLIVLVNTSRKTGWEIDDLDIFGASMFRAKRAMLYRLLKIQQKRFVKMIGHGGNFVLSYEFNLLSRSEQRDERIGFIIKCSNIITYIVINAEGSIYVTKEFNSTTTNLVEVSFNLLENRWYKLTMRMVGGQIFFGIIDESERLSMSIEFKYEEPGDPTYGIFIQNYSFLTIKNVEFESINYERTGHPADFQAVINLYLNQVLIFLWIAALLLLMAYFVKIKRG